MESIEHVYVYRLLNDNVKRDDNQINVLTILAWISLAEKACVRMLTLYI